MLKQVRDAFGINEVLNHPAVFPWVSSQGVERIDMSSVMDRCVVLMTERGGFIFDPVDEGTYEVHTQFLPGTRDVLELAREAAAFMFERCDQIITRVPEGNERAKRLTQRMGFHYFKTDGVWIYPDGRESSVDWYELTKEMWACPQQR